MTSSYVLRFDDEHATVHDLVGGKGANLGRLAGAGFPVPAGFTVTTDAYQAFLDSGGLRDEIAALVGGLDHAHPDELERVTASIRERIVGRAFPDELVAPIVAAYGDLGEWAYVAVRSSGTAEDLADASFAGMHDTYLDITGADAVLDAVKRCWASLWTARAASYRHTKGFDHSNGIAVVVQTMVPSEVAGVMFTANPMTSATDEIVINASWGLGEAIVAGITTPDEYTLAHRDLRVIDKVLGSKEKRVVRDPVTGVGTVEEATPAAEREEFSLSDEEAAELGDLGRRVQAYYGEFPQDTEWGFAGGQFFLLQSRPVTGVDLTWDAELEDWQWLDEAPDDQVWTRAWADAVWSGGCTPLMYSLRGVTQTNSNLYGMNLWGLEEPKGLRLFKYHKGGAYYNCSMDESILVNTAFPTTRAAMLENVPPAWRERILDEPFSVMSYLKLQVRCQFLDKSAGIFTWRKDLDKHFVRGIDRAMGLPDDQLRKLTDKELQRQCEKANALDQEYIGDVWTAFFIQGRDSMGLLAHLVANWYDGPNRMAFTDLITGVPRPTATQKENTALWELAQTIRESDTLSKAFEEHEGAAFFDQAGDSEEGRDWLARYDAFIAENGHRGHSNRDVYHLRRGEDPAVDYRAMSAILASGVTEHPSAKEHAVEARRQETIAEVTANIRQKSLGALRAEIFKGTLDYVMMFLLFRDDERHWMDRVTYIVKRCFKEVGRRLYDRGMFETERDFYFLSDRELYAMLHGGGNPPLATAKIAARAHHFDRIETGGTNPMYLVRNKDADLEYDRMPGEDLPEGMFVGAGTSGGTIEGTARVVYELKDIGRVREGEILIVNATDPGWTPVFLVISGIVVETGGMLAHASCLAREYGMPAVHLPKAMSLVPDGATVRINGDAGSVEILEAPEATAKVEDLVTA